MIHVVEQGECLSSIAKSYGFADWRDIYNRPQNAAFRAKRPNPNVIYPKDEIFIPDKRDGTRSCTTGGTYKFRLKSSRTLLRLEPQDAQWHGCAGKKFKLEVDGNVQAEGAIPADGVIEVSIRSDAKSGVLTVWIDASQAEGQTWELRLGELDPVDSMEGVQARLNNLGFDCGAVDGENGPMTREAVRAFQKMHGLVPDGIAGPITKAKLEKVHGS